MVGAIPMLNLKMRNIEIKEWAAPDNSLAGRNPVEYQTENGFAIIRLCDVDKTVSRTGSRHYFIVRDPHGYELDIAVEISNDAVAEVMRRGGDRLTLESSFWIVCAERHLADYLWENEDYPPGAKLIVNQLTIEDLDSARRWNCDEKD